MRPNKINKLGTVVQAGHGGTAFNPALGRQIQEDLYKSKARQIYRKNSRAGAGEEGQELQGAALPAHDVSLGQSRWPYSQM